MLLVGVLVGTLLHKNNAISPKTNEKQEVKVKKEIKIAQMPLGFGTFFPLFVAQQEGFFDKYSLTVKFEQIDRSLSVQALLAKSVDYTPFVEETTMASLKGAPVKTIMLFAENLPACLVIRPGIKPEDIKYAAIVGQGTWGHIAALKFFRKIDISPKITFLSDLNEAISMLATKHADITGMSLPTSFQLREKGYSIIELSDEEALFGLATTDDKIKNNPEEVKEVIKAIQSAIDFIRNNPEKTKELLFSFYKYEKNEVNNKIINDIYDVAKKTFKNIKIPNQATIREVIQIEKNVKFENLEQIDSQTVTPEDISNSFDFRFIK